MYGKPLAYIVKIDSISPIEGADKIELAHVMDYTVVVKKQEFQPGDLALYVEVDSVLPDGFTPEQKVTYEAIKDGSYFKGLETTVEEANAAMERLKAASKYPYFEFLRDKKFKIKSMKLSKFGVISQGILFRPSDVKITDAKKGKDYTEYFGIKEIVQDEEEAGLNTVAEKDNWFVRKLMRYKWFRDWRKLKKVSETWDASFPGKSDEENVQKLFTKMKEKYGNKTWALTEKLEGQNISIFSENVMRPTLFGLFRKKEVKEIGVCSRTRRLSKNGTGKNFWATVERLKLDEKIKKIPGEWWCRGEHVGPGIQGNIYKLPETDVIFFDFYRKEYYIDIQDRNKRKFKWVKLDYEDSKLFAQQWGLKFVPVIDDNYTLPDTAQEMLAQSDKNTEFGFNLSHKREGFVARLKDDYNVSFKVKNPFYSI